MIKTGRMVVLCLALSMVWCGAAFAGYYGVCCDRKYWEVRSSDGTFKRIGCTKCRMFPIKPDQGVEMKLRGCEWFNMRRTAEQYFRRNDTCP
jgi:hypothetical protein